MKNDVQTYRWNGPTFSVRGGIFEWKGLKFHVHGPPEGKCDVGVVVSCAERNGFSYWEDGPYRGVVVDIGAHIGAFTCDVARTARKVYAYEALKENYDLLVRNVALNNLTNVECFHLAAGDGSRKSLGISNSGATSGSSIVFTKDRAIEEVDGISFRDVVSRAGGRVGLMKLDCEAAEYEFLLGLPARVVRQVRVFTMEVHWHPEHSHEELFRFMESCGYKGEPRASKADSCRMVNYVRS